eukprot:g7766.t1
MDLKRLRDVQWHATCVRVLPAQQNEVLGLLEHLRHDICALGHFQDGTDHRVQVCKECAPGTYAPAPGANGCTKCTPGTFQDDAHAVRCRDCPAGKFANLEGMAVCLQCVPGTVSAADASTACVNCEAGRYQGGVGESTCSLCEAGQVDAGVPRVACAFCAEGQFKSEKGLGYCKPCRQNMVSNGARSDCICQVGFYGTNHSGARLECHKCRAGMRCNRTDLAFDDLRSLPGYWQVKPWFEGEEKDTMSMLQCPVLEEQLCLGGHDDMPGDRAPGHTCREGHTGPLCSTCAQGYQSNARGLCIYCSETGFTLPVRLAIVSGAALLSVLLLAWWMRSHKDQIMRGLCRAFGKSAKKGVPSPMKKARLQMKLKILLGFFQVASQMIENFDIAWPSSFARFASAFAFVNLDLPSLGCVADLNFVDKFLSAIISPLAICAPFAILYCVCGALWEVHHVAGAARRNEKGRLEPLLHASNLCLKAILWILFLVYPSTSSKILQMWDCVPLQNGESYLRADMSIQCGGSQGIPTQMFGSQGTYATYSSLAAVFIFVYPIGVPLLFLGVLFVNRKQLYAGDAGHEADAEMEEELGFLYLGYTRKYWWWECVELLRKLTLTGLVVFIAPGTPTQLFVVVLLAQLFIVAYARQSPYFDGGDNDLQLVCQLQIWFTALSGLAVKMSGDIDGGAGDRSFESSAFDALLVFMGTAPMIMIVIQVVVEMTQVVSGAKEELADDAAGDGGTLAKSDATETKDSKRTSLLRRASASPPSQSKNQADAAVPVRRPGGHKKFVL